MSAELPGKKPLEVELKGGKVIRVETPPQLDGERDDDYEIRKKLVLQDAVNRYWASLPRPGLVTGLAIRYEEVIKRGGQLGRGGTVHNLLIELNRPKKKR